MFQNYHFPFNNVAKIRKIILNPFKFVTYTTKSLLNIPPFSFLVKFHYF